MTLRILTPTQSRTLECVAVFLPGTAGAFEVLAGHAPLVSTLTKGEIRWRTASGPEESVSISAGAIMVRANIVTVCADI